MLRPGICNTIVFLAACCMITCAAAAREIHSKRQRYSLIIPDKLWSFNDNASSQTSGAYLDTSARIVMIISARKGKFRNVKDYIDCSRLELENLLQADYNDSTLRLMGCDKPLYYPDKITEVRFEVKVPESGYGSYMIFFVHHRRYDIQIAFTFQKTNQQPSALYIHNIMKTLVLK